MRPTGNSTASSVTEDPCILVLGISGSGKTTACLDAVRSIPTLRYVSASELLRAATSSTPERFSTRTDREAEADQFRLADLLIQYRLQMRGHPVLIDAHATVATQDGHLTVPLKAIASISPTAIALVEKPVHEVDSQRRRDLSRHRPTRSHQQLADEMANERRAAEGYASNLGLRLGTIPTATWPSLLNFIEAAIQS